jgi:hypothetical protein
MLAAPPPAIALARSIAGISLGARRATLTTRLGAGALVQSGTGSFGPFAVVRYPSPAVKVTFVRGVATSVGTVSQRYRTALGVSVGTGAATVRHAYGSALRCGNFQICTVGKALPGKAVTTFYLADGRVREIDVSRVLD